MQPSMDVARAAEGPVRAGLEAGEAPVLVGLEAGAEPLVEVARAREAPLAVGLARPAAAVVFRPAWVAAEPPAPQLQV